MTEAKGEQENERLWNIPKDHELRFEVGASEVIIIALAGRAECFGTELVLQKEYKFSHTKKAIFTYHDDCQVLVIGKPDIIYLSISATASMSSYCNLHAQLNKLRTNAKSAQLYGPRVLLCGPPDSGKSTVSCILLNYALRTAWWPMFIDLDVSDNAITIPGTISATPIVAPFDVVDDLVVKQELSFFYGHTSPFTAPEFYLKQCGQLAKLINQRHAKHETEKYSGCIINTYACLDNDKKTYAMLLDLAKLFDVDLVIVLGDEKLTSQLTFDIKLDPKITLLQLPKLTGVVIRDRETKRESRQRAFRNYFYGSKTAEQPLLCCHTQIRKFNDVPCFRVGHTTPTPTSVLPLDTQPLLNPTRLEAYDFNSQDTKQSIVGVSFATRNLQMAEEPVSGFALIIEQDSANQTITLLTPAPELASCTLFLGSLKWTP